MHASILYTLTYVHTRVRVCKYTKKPFNIYQFFKLDNRTFKKNGISAIYTYAYTQINF